MVVLSAVRPWKKKEQQNKHDPQPHLPRRRQQPGSPHRHLHRPSGYTGVQQIHQAGTAEVGLHILLKGEVEKLSYNVCGLIIRPPSPVYRLFLIWDLVENSV